MEAYRAVFEDGTRRLAEWAARTKPARLVFTSSTSVYAQTDGSVVTESSLAEGAGETGRILRAAEDVCLSSMPAGTRVTVLRVAGIYGPGRGHLFLKYLRDEAVITGDPGRWLNQAHRDDVAGAIQHLLEAETAPELLNVADNEPVRQEAFFRWLSERLGRAMPPAGEAPKGRKRAVTNKRVSNERLRRELGYRLRYPTFREGYRAEMERLGLPINRS